MKIRLLLLLFLVSASVSHDLRADPPSLREKLSFNREWKFELGDHPGGESPGYDDTRWESIGLPHSFSLPYFAAGNAFYVGYGWYRKHFELPVRWVGKRLFLDFEGAFQDAEIFVNGKRIGAHQGGYTGFEIEITDTTKPGDNMVAVRLNNLWNPRLAPRAGEHVFSGGLYRSVWLVAADPLHVTWYGTDVTTPRLSRASGEVNVRTEVANQSGVEKQCELRTDIVEPSGRVTVSMKATHTIPPAATFTFDQTSATIPNPGLWSPETPTLYRVVTRVIDDGHPVDEFETPFGFRWFEWTADKGFFLNGERRYFKGANVHQDHAGWGDAVTDAGSARDVKMMKDAGFDFIRGSHYPHSPAFSRACDEQGMLFWSENCFWATYGDNKDGYWTASGYPVRAEDDKPFEESVRQQLREMIRIHRNHPSIVVWSMGNEAFFAARQEMPKVRAFLKELIDYTHGLDPTRPAAIGGVQRGEIDRIGDVAGYNGDGARLPQFQNPGVPNVVSEYSSVSADRPGKYEPGWGDLPQSPGLDKDQPYPWHFPWRSGEAIWCGFDHGSIAGRKFGAMGLVDYFRLPKRAWYWYRNEYAKVAPPEWPEPGTPAALKLEADKPSITCADGTDDVQLIVTILDEEGRAISNAVPVTLTVESGPGEFPTGPSITFAPDSDIAIRDGRAAMELRSYHAGTTVVRATSPGLKDASITLATQGGPPFVEGKTSTARPRVYRPVIERNGTNTALVFGTNNPTWASSEAADHSGRLANDGNEATFWQAATPGEAWWQVDLERNVIVERVTLAFPTDGNWGYQIAVSEDGSQWKTVIDQARSAAMTKLRTDAVATGTTGRFVRVIFTATPPGQPAAIAEFGVTGRFAQ